MLHVLLKEIATSVAGQVNNVHFNLENATS